MPNQALIRPVSAASSQRAEGHMAERDQEHDTGRDLTWDEVRRAIERAAREDRARDR
jgi:hypothetical protein